MKVDILAFGAHPDDVEIGAAGTLIKAARAGRATAAVTLTRGEMGTRGTVGLRKIEFDRASEVMGLNAHEMLSLPDGRLVNDEASRLEVIRVIRNYRPEVILLHYHEDRHPDHEAASRIVREAAFFSGLRKLDTGQEPHRPLQLVFFMHTWEFTPSFVVDVSETFEEKKRAIRCYRSQVYTETAAKAEEQTFVSSPDFWELQMARAAYYGRLIGKRFGEPFWVRGLIEVRDLAETFGGSR
jgi:bacillithiol biosynthesis deacetylase BshB1